MYENKKIGGILIESKMNDQAILNIGLGLNVNEDSIDFPSDLQKKSISLKEIKGYPIQREPLLASIFNALDLLIENIDTSTIIEYWMNHCSHKDKNLQLDLRKKNSLDSSKITYVGTPEIN